MTNKTDELCAAIETLTQRLDKVVNLLTVISDLMTQDGYLRSRAYGAEVYDPYEDDQ